MTKDAERTRAYTESELAPQRERRWRVVVFQAYLIAALALFAFLAVLARSAAYFPIDLVITQALQAYGWPWFDLLMRIVSWPGYGPQVLGVIAVLSSLLWVLGLHREALVSALDGLAALLSNNLIKLAIARPRPSPDLVDVIKEVSGFSFPSGHVMFYTAYFGFLFFLSYTMLKPSWKRTLLLLLFGALVVLVGPSRIYLGNHWASDVFAAYLLGSLILAGAIRVYTRWDAKQKG